MTWYGFRKTYVIEPENRLREFRVEKGLSQIRLAQEAGIKKGRSGEISALEIGKVGIINIQTGRIKKWVEDICAVLERTPAEVFPQEICNIMRGEFTDEQLIDLTMGQSNEKHEPISGIVLEKWLTDRENRLVYMRFSEGASLQDIADEFGVTRERIRQMEARALRKIKRKLKQNPSGEQKIYI